jgi:hypothetical protein
MHVAIKHFNESATRAGVEFTSMEIMEVSFRIVIYVLSHRDRRAPHRASDLSLETADLLGEPARSLCSIYCESMFPTDYARRTASLTGMSLDAFGQYERDRRPEMLEKGLLAS